MESSLNNIGLKYAFDFGKGKNYKGGDKTSLGKNFTESYELVLNHLKDEKINLLELGIYFGKSIAMWSDYFKNGTIYGIDINLKCFNLHEPLLKKNGAFINNNIKIFEQDITNKNFVDLIEKLPNLDIIIDDADHKAETQLNNFKLLFPKLNKGGYYIIEDIVFPFKFMELFKEIYMCVSNPDSNGVKTSKLYSLANKIESIQIKNNLIIIKKYN